MKKYYILLLVSFSSLITYGQVDMVNDDLIEIKTDHLISQYMELDLFSGVVLIAEKGKPIYHKAFGLADRENERANELNTLFDIGSMNKTFTSVVVKQLISEGKLKFDDKLVDFIEGFRDPIVKQVTINHLLNHESGFGDYHNDGYFDLPRSEKKLANIVERVKKDKLLFVPGESNEYSNTGYILLGAIIEEVTGITYFENVKQRIIAPLELKNTYVGNFDRFESRVAYGYLYSPLGALEKNETLQDLPNPDGGFLSTTEDILKFYRSYYYDDLLLDAKTKSDDPFFKFVNSLPEGKAPIMAGGFEGFNTAFLQVVSDDRSIIVFANMDEPVAEQLAMGILEITRGNEPEKPQLPAIQNVRKAFEVEGSDFVRNNFDSLTKNYHPMDPKDWILNDLGYAFIFAKNDLDNAIKLFKINTELFPGIANVWDSYGEALVRKGDTTNALTAYRKALEINPNSPTARKAIEELQGKN